MTRRRGPLLGLFTSTTTRALLGAAVFVLVGLLAATGARGAPKVIVISLDGATPRFVDQYLASGAISPNTGLALLREKGLTARQNLTITPSLTAPGHIAIATGSRRRTTTSSRTPSIWWRVPSCSRSAASPRRSADTPSMGPREPGGDGRARLARSPGGPQDRGGGDVSRSRRARHPGSWRADQSHRPAGGGAYRRLHRLSARSPA
jgi:Type I phosphodiesterase / nucleotide pyrophosphatase